MLIDSIAAFSQLSAGMTLTLEAERNEPWESSSNR